ncbi:MAG: hypothetical protein ACFCD0_29810 [Gemmataceae bacterium]
MWNRSYRDNDIWLGNKLDEFWRFGHFKFLAKRQSKHLRVAQRSGTGMNLLRPTAYRPANRLLTGFVRHQRSAGEHG